MVMSPFRYEPQYLDPCYTSHTAPLVSVPLGLVSGQEEIDHVGVVVLPSHAHEPHLIETLHNPHSSPFDNFSTSDLEKFAFG